MAYGEQFRNKVRDDWVTEKYKNITELAKAHALPQRSLISNWIKKYDWADYKNEVQQVADEKTVQTLAEQISQVNQTHFRVWQGILGQCISKMQRPAPDEPPPVIETGELRTIASIVAQAQGGQRLAINADDAYMGEVERDVEITFAGIEEAIEAAERHKDTKERVAHIKGTDDLLESVEVFDPDEAEKKLEDIL